MAGRLCKRWDSVFRCFVIVFALVLIGGVNLGVAEAQQDGKMHQGKKQDRNVQPQLNKTYPQEVKNLCPPEKIVFISAFGDSLTSGYGLDDPSTAFPVVLQKRLRALGYNVVVENDGVAGETTAQGRKRLSKILSVKPDIIIMELGANDMLQHKSVERMKTNLSAMIEEIQYKKVHLLLAGMLSLPHFGNKYAESFEAVYPALAKRYDVALYPFFLEGAVLKHSLSQEDGFHPNAEGVNVIVHNMLPYLVKEIQSVCK